MFRINVLKAIFVTSALFLGAILVARSPLCAYQKPDSGVKEQPPETSATGTKLESGRWAIVPFIVGKGQNAPMFLLDVTDAGPGGLEARVVDNATGRQGWIVKSITSEGGKLNIDLVADAARFVFDGTRQPEFARGELVMPSGFVGPTRIWPTTAASIEKYVPPEEEHLAERLATSRAEGEAQITGLLSFAEKYPQSPLALDACQEILRVSNQKKLDAATVEKVVKKYLELTEYWGKYLVQHSRIAVAEILCDTPEYNAIALQSITAAEKDQTDDDPHSWARDIEVIKGYTLIRSPDDVQRKQGATILWTYHDDNIFDNKLTAELLNYEQSHGDLDKAIDLAAQFAAFPPTQEMNAQWNAAKRSRLDVPAKLKEQFSSLWVKKHGNTDGLEKRLDDAYLTALKELKIQRDELPKEERGNRVAVVELFTGATCPPCLAVDMAVANVAQSYPSTDVAILRYQQNSPLPDPMANLPGELRTRYYSVKGTPTAFVDGSKVDFVDGFRDRVPQVEAVLRDAIDADLQSNGEIELKISAENQDGLLVLAAEAGKLRELAFRRRFARFGIAVVATTALGVVLALALVLLGNKSAKVLTARFDAPWLHTLLKKRVRLTLACFLLILSALVGYQLVPDDNDLSDLRLRMAITEDQISFAASNGVRIHDGVVRAMPADVGGVPAKGGRLAFSVDINLVRFRQQLLAQMATIEMNKSVKFPVKPLELRHLNFVAFVQSDTTREILQAASVPVEGFPAAPPPAAGPQPPPSTPAANSAKPVTQNAPAGDAKPAAPTSSNSK